MEHYSKFGTQYVFVEYSIDHIYLLPQFTHSTMMGNKAIQGGSIGDNYYHIDITKLNEEEEEEEKENNLKKRKLASWHPGPKGHEFEGAIIGYKYLILLQKSLIKFKSLIEKFNDNVNLSDKIYDEYKILKSKLYDNVEIPKPIGCDERLCLNKFPQCFTLFEPRIKNELSV